MRRITAVLVAAAVLLLPSTGAANGVDREDSVQNFARDVFVLAGASLVNPDVETHPSATLYSVGGEDLGITWGEWQHASATSRAVAIGGPFHPSTDFHISLDGLIPNGVYSIFYGTLGPDTNNPLCPNVERTLPLTSLFADQQPDSSSFVADEDGSADFHGRVEGHLLDAEQVFLSIIYHYDGQTYGQLPNRGEHQTQGPDCRSSFGLDAMRQMLVLQKW